MDTLVIIEDRLEPVRRYFRVRPPRVPVAVDEPRATYRAYGVPLPTYSPEYKQLRETVPMNPTGELPAPMSLVDGQKFLNERDRMGETPEAEELMKQFLPRDFVMHVGHFLVDRDGVVRWTHIETPADDLSRWGCFPTDDELVAASRVLAGGSRTRV